VTALFNNQPALKGFLGLDDDDKPGGSNPAEGKPNNAIKEKNEEKPIESPEEMRMVAKTLREGLRLLLEEQGNPSQRLTESAKKALAVVRQKQEELMEPVIEISDKEFLGLPPGTRLLNAPTFFMFWLAIAEVNGKQKIIWAQFLGPIC
jgi:hypothetical protein